MFIGNGFTIAIFIPVSPIHPKITFTAVQATLFTADVDFIWNSTIFCNSEATGVNEL